MSFWLTLLFGNSVGLATVLVIFSAFIRILFLSIQPQRLLSSHFFNQHITSRAYLS